MIMAFEISYLFFVKICNHKLKEPMPNIDDFLLVKDNQIIYICC